MMLFSEAASHGGHSCLSIRGVILLLFFPKMANLIGTEGLK